MKSLILICLLSYIVGSIPFGYIITKIFKKIDIRTQGSGNIGATNVTRTSGILYGIIVLILDFGKGILAVKLFSLIHVGEIWIVDIEIAKALAGICVVLGHMFTIFLSFKGGKGVATASGAFLSMNSYAFSISFIIFLVVFIITKYVSVSSVFMSITYPILLILLQQSAFYIYAAIFCFYNYNHKTYSKYKTSDK